jgi:hypothetical protein
MQRINKTTAATITVAAIAVATALGLYLYKKRPTTNYKIEPLKDFVDLEMGQNATKNTNKDNKKESFQIPDNPKSLEDFGFAYNEAGELRNIIMNEKFNLQLTQQQYEVFGNFIVEYVTNKMKVDYDMEKVLLPTDATTTEPQTDIYMTKNWKDCEKLLVLIQGSGAVRPGMWARSVCINDGLKNGAVYSYIDAALKDNYGVIVLNPNNNKVRINSKLVPIRGSSSPEEHTLSVWDEFISQSNAKDIVIVAHSYGGVCTMNLLEYRNEAILARVRAIAFTDSVHSSYPLPYTNVKKDPTASYLKERCVNWITSNTPLDTEINVPKSNCPCVSAGHTKHEYTSASAFPSVMKFINEKVAK